MIVLGEKPTTSEEWQAVDLSEIGSFDVLLRHPTFSDVVVDSELGAGFTAYRLKACVKGWRGVQDEAGHDVPFSFARFENLCLRYPKIIYQVGGKLHTFYAGMTEESRKNSSAPPDAPSRPAAVATTEVVTDSTSAILEPLLPGASSAS